MGSSRRLPLRSIPPRPRPRPRTRPRKLHPLHISARLTPPPVEGGCLSRHFDCARRDLNPQSMDPLTRRTVAAETSISPILKQRRRLLHLPPCLFHVISRMALRTVEIVLEIMFPFRLHPA